LPDLIASIKADRTVPILIVEGEGKVDELAKLGIVATCCAEGSGKWTAQHSAHLKGADCVISPDNDDSGRKHLDVVALSLVGIAAHIRVLELPGLDEKGDVIDWLAKGGTREELADLVDEAPAGEPRQESERATTTDEDDELGKMLAQYAIVLVGGSARIITWKNAGSMWATAESMKSQTSSRRTPSGCFIATSFKW
jgi:DNA primase